MAVDLSKLNQTIATLTAEVTRLEGLAPSIVALLQGQAEAIIAAVTKALEDDNKADQTTIDAATGAAQDVADRFKAKGDELATAVSAHSGDEEDEEPPV